MMAREVVQMAVVAERRRSGQEFRWSVSRKTDAVMRLLRGEDLDTVARELRVEAHRMAAWRDEFVAAGQEGLKARTHPARRPQASGGRAPDRQAHDGARGLAGGGAKRGSPQLPVGRSTVMPPQQR